MSMSPSVLALNITKIVCFTMRSLSIRNMLPIHCRRRSLIHLTRSNVCHFLEGPWCCALPVITEIICAFAPFITLLTSTVRYHASDPYSCRLGCCILSTCTVVVSYSNTSCCRSTSVSVCRIWLLPSLSVWSRQTCKTCCCRPLRTSNPCMGTASNSAPPFLPSWPSAIAFAVVSFSRLLHLGLYFLRWLTCPYLYTSFVFGALWGLTLTFTCMCDCILCICVTRLALGRSPCLTADLIAPRSLLFHLGIRPSIVDFLSPIPAPDILSI